MFGVPSRKEAERSLFGVEYSPATPARIFWRDELREPQTQPCENLLPRKNPSKHESYDPEFNTKTQSRQGAKNICCSVRPVAGFVFPVAAGVSRLKHPVNGFSTDWNRQDAKGAKKGGSDVRSSGFSRLHSL
jgi:hypothetical protein